MRTKLLNNENVFQKANHRLEQLEQGRKAVLLLKNYMTVPKLLYLLRSTPTFNHIRLLTRMDETIHREVTKITNVALDGNSWRQAGYLASLGGLGVRTVSDLARPAYLTSTHLSATDHCHQLLCRAKLCASVTSATNKWKQGTKATPPEESKRIHHRLWDRATAADTAESLIEASEDLTARARLLAAVRSHSGAG